MSYARFASLRLQLAILLDVIVAHPYTLSLMHRSLTTIGVCMFSFWSYYVVVFFSLWLVERGGGEGRHLFINQHQTVGISDTGEGFDD